MHTTLSLLADLTSHFNNCSDYALAPKLGISKNTISTWRTRHTVMKDETGCKAARILRLSEDVVLISLAAERAQGTPIADKWEELFNKVAA